LPSDAENPAPGGAVAGSRGGFLFALRLILTVVTLGAVFHYAWKGRALFEGEWSWNYPWLMAAISLTPLLLAGRAWKWLLLVRPLDGSITFRQAFRSYVGCLPLGLVTPGRLGEFSRGMYLPQRAVQGLAGAGRVFLDNWTDMLGALFWCIPGCAALWGWQGFVLGCAAFLVLAPVRPWMRLLSGSASLLPGLWGLKRVVLSAIPDRRHLRPGGMAAALAAGAALWGVEWLQMDFLLRFLGADPGAFWKVAGLMALVTLANSVQVTLAGLGVREGLAAYLLATAGIGLAPSLVAAFGLFFLNLLLPSLAGLAVRPPDLGGLGRRLRARVGSEPEVRNPGA